ncbi:MAG: hypothetical protein ACOYXR_04595 [Nitrospirota bacterium]
MAIPRHTHSTDGAEDSGVIDFARRVEQGLSEDLKRLHADLIEEESRLTALEEIRRHSMRDFETLSEQGVTTIEAAMYYTLFHHLTQEISMQGRLVVNARLRVSDKQTAVRAAREDRLVAERRYSGPASPGMRQVSATPSRCGAWASHRPALKKAS